MKGTNTVTPWMACRLFIIAPVAQLGETETEKGPVDLFPVERPAMDGGAGVDKYQRCYAMDGE